MKRTPQARMLALAPLLYVTACTQIPQNAGRAEVDALLRDAGREAVPAAPPEISDGVLQIESAVRLALGHSPTLQAALAKLGFAAADLYAASRIRNPLLSFSALDPNQRAGDQLQLNLGLEVSFADMLTRARREEIASEQMTALQADVAGRAVAAAAEVEIAWYAAVEARQRAELRNLTARAAGLQAELAQRFHDAGNISPRELALAEAVAAEENLRALDARKSAFDARAKLAMTIGIAVDAPWTLPDSLPLPAETDPDAKAMIDTATVNRLDIRAAQARVQADANAAGLANWSRYLEGLELGAEYETESEGGALAGPALAIELPLLNQNRDQLLRAEASLEQSAAQLRGLQIAMRNHVHAALFTMGNARSRIATYRDQLIPARARATARAQEEQNFMLIGAFELLSTRAQEFEAWAGYIEAVAGYWTARSALTRAVGRTLPAASTGNLSLDNFSPAQNPPANAHHHHH